MSQTIGVVLTTYNGERFIREQIESILTQTLGPKSIVIVDDNSRDRTLDILEDYCKTDHRIKLYKNKHTLGWIKNFEKGISLCDADYIALSDQDDIWLPDKLETCIKKMASHRGCGLCYHDAWLMHEGGTRLDITLWQVSGLIYPLPKMEAQGILFSTRSPISGFTMVFEKKLKELIFPFPGYKCCGHDWWISAVSFLLLDPVHVDTPLAYHRLHYGQSVGDPISKLKKTKYALKKNPLDSERIKRNIGREIYRVFHRKEFQAQRREDEKSRREEFAGAFQRLKEIIEVFNSKNNAENKKYLMEKVLSHHDKLLNSAR